MKKAVYPDFKIGEELYTVGREMIDRSYCIYGPVITKNTVVEIEYKTVVKETAGGFSEPIETKSYQLDDGSWLSEYNLIQRSFLTEKEAKAKYLRDVNAEISEANIELDEVNKKLELFTKLKEQHELVE